MKTHGQHPSPKARTLELFLDSEANPYVRQIQAEAEAEAMQHGLRVDTFFSDNRFLQIQQLYRAIHAQPAQRPAAVAVLPTRDGSLARVARAALERGIDWICLHRRTGDLDGLRAMFPRSAVTLVGPDQREVGRLQGGLARKLAPGGAILYVEGGAGTVSAGERLTGFRELADEPCNIVGIVDGNWTAGDTQSAVGRWLNVMTPTIPRLDAVVCQSDTMAVGASVALRDAAVRLDRSDLASVPVIGCDGMIGEGRLLVDEGLLAATVVIEGVGTQAVRVLADRLRGRRGPAERLLELRPYPATMTSAGAPPWSQKDQRELSPTA